MLKDNPNIYFSPGIRQEISKSVIDVYLARNAKKVLPKPKTPSERSSDFKKMIAEGHLSNTS